MTDKGIWKAINGCHRRSRIVVSKGIKIWEYQGVLICKGESMEERFLLSKHQGMQFSSRVNGVMRRSEWRYGLWLRNKFEAGIGSRKTQLPVLILWFDREEV